MKHSELTPREIVTELDKYIVGQKEAKKAVAIAIRNRWRRQQLPKEMRDEVMPKNIIMMGPTGVGKTEIARRLAMLLDAPFIKVEASNYTEVGYVGRDVEGMIRDLMNKAVSMVQREQLAQTGSKAEDFAKSKLLDMLVDQDEEMRRPAQTGENLGFKREQLKAQLRQQLDKGQLRDREVEMNVQSQGMPQFEQLFQGTGMDKIGFDFQNIIGKMIPGKQQQKVKKMRVADALNMLQDEEGKKLIDMDKVHEIARHRVEDSGIVFIDEFDKIAHRESEMSGISVSREGVQRDLLPLVEGSVVHTQHGPIRTHHILFIAAGAFHVSSPSDLIPEMQGRFPIRVRLNPLSREDFVKILTVPANAIIKQYQALLATEDVKLEFTEDAIDEIARIAEQVNNKHLDIGARRLQTILEKLLDDIAFQAPEVGKTDFVLDRESVFLKLAGVIDDDDISRYAL